MTTLPKNTPKELIDILKSIDFNGLTANERRVYTKKLEDLVVRFIPARTSTPLMIDFPVDIPQELAKMIYRYDIMKIPRLLQIGFLPSIKSWVNKNLPLKKV